MSQLLTEQDVADIIRVSSGKGPRILSYSLESREKYGYLGTHLTLQVRLLDGGEEREESFFLKTYTAPQNPDKDFIGQTGMFTKEVSVYKDIFAKFRLNSSGPEWAPKYYFSKSSVLVLEDLSREGFAIKTGSSMLDKDHLEIVFKTLASLHAHTLLFEEKEGKEIDLAYPNCFKEFLYSKDNKDTLAFMWQNRQTQDVTVAVDFLSEYSSSQKDMIKRYILPTVGKIYPLSRKSERWANVMVHGDMWSNNLMFRYIDGKPVDCRLVDYQFIRYAPPMHDVMHLLHLTTDKSFRLKHEDDLVKIYYDHLRDCLSIDGIDIGKFYNREEFLQSKTEYKLLALIQSLLTIHYLLGGRKVQEDPKLKDLNRHEVDEYLSETRRENMRNNFEDKNYATRIGGILCELIDEYILNENQREQMDIAFNNL